MTAFNVVRFRVKPGREQEFVAAHRNLAEAMTGFRGGSLVKTGDRTYCFIGQWNSFGNIVSNRPKMIGLLDRFRDMLEDLGGDLGVTDPVSGEVVAEIRPKVARKAKRAKRGAKSSSGRAAAKKKPPKRGTKRRSRR
jgi:hypothetical protein